MAAASVRQSMCNCNRSETEDLRQQLHQLRCSPGVAASALRSRDFGSSCINHGAVQVCAASGLRPRDFGISCCSYDAAQVWRCPL